MFPETNAARALLLLCSVVRHGDWVGQEDELAQLSAEQWKRLAARATHHGLAGLVSRNLDWARERRAISVPVAEELAARRRQVLTQNLARRAAARQVSDILRREGIPFIVLKGVALAEETYGDLSLRGFNDFDVMVPHERVEQTYRLARDLGYGLIRFTKVQDCIRAGGHAAGMSRRDGVSLDIHWTLGPDLPPGSAAIVWNSCVAAPENATLPGHRLSPEMSLVHLAKHFHTGQYTLLKPLVDFHFTVRTAVSIDQSALLSTAQSLDLVSIVQIAAVVAARAIGTPLPVPMHDAGKPGWAARVAARVLPDAMLVDAAEKSRIGNWLRYLAAAGGPEHTLREIGREFFPGPLALAQFFNAPYRFGMYPSYYWRQLAKVLTLSSK